MKNNNIKSILIAYLGCFFIVPVFIHAFYKPILDFQFNGMDNYFIILLILFFWISAYIVMIFFKSIINPMKPILPSLLDYSSLNKVLIIIFSVVSVVFYFSYGINFRHTTSISEAEAWVSFLLILRNYIKAFLFIAVIKLISNRKAQVENHYFFIIGFSFYLSMISSFDIILILTSLLISFNKTSLIFKSRKNKTTFLNNFLVRSILIIFTVIATLFIGTANKVGIDRASNEIFNKTTFSLTLGSLGMRASVWYASVFSAYEGYSKNKDEIKYAMNGTFRNLFNRLGYIYGQTEIKKLKYWSVMRANYLSLWKNNLNPKSGTSPGVVASIFFFPYHIFGFFLLAIFTGFILARISLVIDNKERRINLLGSFILVFFLMPYFESPLDLINFIDPYIIYMILTLISFKFNHWNQFYSKQLKI